MVDTTVFEEAFGPESPSGPSRTLSRDATSMRQSVDAWHDSHADKRRRIYEAGMETVRTWQEEAPSPVPAFADTMTKDEMIEHLYQVHGHRGNVNGHNFSLNGTKATKTDLIRLHESLHSSLDKADAALGIRWRRRVDDDDFGRTDFTFGGTPVPTVKHEHQEIVLTPDAKAARSGKRVEGVLSVQERKALTQVVDNDFGGLKQEMRTFAADALANQTAQINADWDDKEKRIPDFADRATARRRTYDDDKRAMEERHRLEKQAMADAYQADFDAVVEEAKVQGVVLTHEDIKEPITDANGIQIASRTVRVFKAAVEGRQDAIKAAADDNKKMLDRALMDLEKQRLTAQRQVLLAGVPDGAAQTVLSDLPDARQMMVDAQRERAALEASKES